MKKRVGAMAFVAILSFLTGGWLLRREASADGDLYQRARLFEDVLTTIQKHYVDSTSAPELYREATEQLVNSLHDPYAELLTGDSYRQYREQVTGTRRATTTGSIDGPGEIRVPAVSAAALLPHGVGYVALHAISQDAADEVAQAVSTLRSKGMRSLVLDLRYDPGGLISEGAAVADLFLDRGDTIAVTRGRTPEHSKVYLDREAQRWPDLPVAVLVNRGTASAAELITTALQDHDRAAIIGQATYGKGVVQTTFKLGDDVALKLTTARWYGPSGRSIQRPLPTTQAEWAPLIVQGDSLRALRFRSSAGRPLASAQGVVPDVAVKQAQLTDRERDFLSALGTDMALYHDVLNGYAKDLKRVHRPAAVGFTVTPEMRDEVRTRLARGGVRVPDEVYEGASAYLAQEIGYAIAREAFGAAAETRRRARDDRQLAAAEEILIRSHGAGDAVALTARSLAAH
jgi:carboxyl-terminal processing protease